jgi:hypothetical protein
MRRAVIGLCGSLLLLTSCYKVELPIPTSLGDLVRIEKVDRVSTDVGEVRPAAGEVLYLFSFEGRNELPFPDVDPLVESAGMDWKDVFFLGVFPLVDSAGMVRKPVFAGSPTSEGTLTQQQWRFNGQPIARYGKWYFYGYMVLPEPKVALVYSVPRGTSGWFLKDGKQRYRIL